MIDQHKPDILSCIANLSSDEVFTPPKVANDVLDLLPQELFSDPKTTFLDPCCKSGVFLREIAKRLSVGLERAIPDLQKRIDHIFHNQLFGLALTELTGLMSRRSVYCSKDASGKYSVSLFKNGQGHIRYKRCEHEFQNGKCRQCGASQSAYDRGEALETHAYFFIHSDRIFNDMQFDVIIGNPPYQLEVGVEKENYSIPIYHLFVQQAKRLNPRYLTMIIPSRWFAGGRGLDEFRREMLNDRRIQQITDFTNVEDCFPGIDLSGGVCYFLWNREFEGECLIKTIDGKKEPSVMKRSLLEEGCDTFIRFNEAIPILKKIRSFKENTFDSIVSPQTPFGILSSFKEYDEKPQKGYLKIYSVSGRGYVSKNILKRGYELIDKYKVFISKSYGERGNYPYRFLAKPFLGEKNACCTQTYLAIGGFNTEEEALNVISYIKTKFFRFCIMLKKNTQDAMRSVYSFVPIQDFSKPWTDEELYQKYGLNDEEIAFIESMIRPME